MENVLIDFDHFRGSQISDTIQTSLTEKRMLEIIRCLNPDFSKDGNQFCYLYGENPQSGISGFGDTVYLAMTDFCNEFYNRKATPIEV